MTKLSIITVCYNEPNLEKTCESIVNQNWQDFEWIVVDGGSNDKFQKIWDKYKYRINTFISEPDNGIYDAMNKGINIANGTYLNFLNAGDYYENNDVLQKVMSQNLEADVITGNLRIITSKFNSKIFIAPDSISKDFFILNYIPHPTSFIKKEVFNKYGKYDTQYKIVADYEKWLNIFVKNNATYKHINNVVAVFNINGISSTNSTLNQIEKMNVLKKYYAEAELEQARMNIKYSLPELIFSIKNSKLDKKYKIITIFGIHIKIKR